MSASISNPQVIATAGCHICAARPGQPCIFTRTEDPRSLRAAAGKSHDDRVIRAKKMSTEKAERVKKALDSISL